MNNRKRMDTLQSLRCFAFLGVFWGHTQLTGFSSSGNWAVSVFLVLSGFVMTYNYYDSDRIQSVTIQDNFRFVVGKMKYLYPLHIITTMFFVFREIIGGTGFDLLNVVLNIMLIQQWIPLKGINSLTGVSWYLCTVVFSYFVFPWINRYMERGYTKRKAVIMIAVSIIFQMIIGWAGKNLQIFGSTNNTWFPDDFVSWLVYSFPLSRIWEFFIGCNLAYIFLHRDNISNRINYDLLELLSVGLVIASNIIHHVIKAISGNQGWWCNTLLFIFSTIIVVYVFAIGKGRISNFLANKYTLYIADISPYAFLIHVVVFNLIAMVYYHIPNVNGVEFQNTYGGWLNVTIGFILTVVCSEIWVRMIRYHKLRKGNKAK